MARKLTVEFIGDTSNLERAFGRADDKAGKFGGSMGKAGKAAAVGLGAGIAAGGVAVLGFVKAAGEAEKSQNAMEAQLRALGISYDKHASKIDGTIQKTAKLAAVDDEDLQGAFTNIVRTTGDVNKSLDLLGVTADFARGKNMDLGKAGEIVAKVAAGNTGILAKQGIVLEKGATATEALGVLQKKFAGQAEAYGNSSAGAQERFRNAVENLQEALGKKFIPTITAVVEKVATFVEGLSDGTGAGGAFARSIGEAFGKARTVVGSVVTAVRGFLDDHRGDLRAAGEAARNVGEAVRAVFEGVMLPVIKRVLPIVQGVVENAFQAIGGAVKVVTGVLTGDFGRAWDGVKRIFGAAADNLLTIVGGLAGAFRDLIGTAMGALASGIKSAGGNLFEAAKNRVAGVVSGVRSIIDDVTQAGRAMVAGIASGIADAGSNLFEAARSRVAGVVSGVRSIIDDLVQAGKSMVLGVATGLREAGTNLKDAALGKAGDILDGFRSIIGEARDIGGRIVSAIGKGLAGAAGLAKSAANTVIRAINGALAGVRVNLPGPLPTVGLPKNLIPYLAEGTRSFAGGLAVVGEEGPELAQLPRGTRVYPAAQTRRMLGDAAGAPSAAPVVNVNGPVRVTSGIEVEALAQRLAFQIATA